MVCDNIFNHALCSSIWVCGPNWAVFGDGDHVRYLSCIVTVDGGRRGEDDIGYIVLDHASEEGDCSANIYAIVFDWDFGGFTNSLDRSVCACANVGGSLEGTLRAAKWITLSMFGCAAKTLSRPSSSVTSTW